MVSLNLHYVIICDDMTYPYILTLARLKYIRRMDQTQHVLIFKLSLSQLDWTQFLWGNGYNVLLLILRAHLRISTHDIKFLWVRVLNIWPQRQTLLHLKKTFRCVCKCSRYLSALASSSEGWGTLVACLKLHRVQ